jgi:alpha-beta hydrolase superfamily lysophospholipase
MMSTEGLQKHLALSDGRLIAYMEGGDPNSDTLVTFFHGVFAIGHISLDQYSPVLREKGVHFLTPTLPGWGESSSVPRSSTFVSCILADVSALINHVHPDTNKLKLYICGGSYGTVAAQIFYGASYDAFPLGRHIVGLLLMAPFSSFQHHSNFGQSLSWVDWIAVGPPARMIPFNLIPHLVKLLLGPKFRTVEGAESFIRTNLYDKMEADERQRLIEWCASRNMTTDEWITSSAGGAVESVKMTWDGYLSTAEVLNADWGYQLPLDEEHSKAHVLVVAAKVDHIAGRGMADFIVDNYKNARLKTTEGGHIGCLPYIEEIWREFLA